MKPSDILPRLFAPVEAPLLLGRYAYLDGLRGLAALAVLFNHYNFFWQRPIGPLVNHERPNLEAPFYPVLKGLYDHGALAVPVFWMISGFIFAAVYPPHSASTRAFAINRLARLYPLHLLTLLVVAGLQMCATAVYGQSLIYEANTLYNFVIQLFFASGWGTEHRLSFNGPIWSVSVEILIYAVFWVVHDRMPARGILWPLVLAMAFLLAERIDAIFQIARCGHAFFAGAAIYAIHRQFSGDRRLMPFAIVAALAAGIGVTALVGLESALFHWLALPALFAGVALFLCELERRAPPHGRSRRLATLIGDNTYGMYLWHIPFMLVLMLALGHAFYLPALARSGWFLLLFVGGVVVIARASFLLVERPARDWLRHRAAPVPPEPRAAANTF